MIDRRSFRKLFPFGFALDADLKITLVGRSLERLIPFREEMFLADLFEIHRQFDKPSDDILTQLFDRPVQLHLKGTPLTLTGEFAPSNAGFLFLGSPKIDRLEELSELQLKINDFSPHDGVMSSLFQVQKMEVISAEAMMAAEDLARQQQIYRQIVEESNDIILALTNQGEVTIANPVAMELLGIAMGSTKTNDFLSAESRETWNAAASSLADGEPSIWVELVLLASQGGEVPVEGHLVRSIADQGESVVGFLRDVTARKLAEQNLAATNQQLQRAHKMEAVGRFAGGIAHDFNNVLGVVIGAASALKEDLPSHDPRRPDLEVILTSAEKGAALAHQILQFSQQNRSLKGRTELVSQAESLRPILDRIVGPRIALSIETRSDQVVVQMDPIQFEQVLLNLAINAEHAMPEGGELEIEIGTLPGREQAFFRVQDCGSGMEPEVLDRIFEPLYSTKPAGKGSGMGLSIVYGIISEAEGKIEVKSEPGQGTCFTVKLPLSDPVESRATTEQPARLPNALDADEDAPRVVVVEDQPALLRLTTRALEGMGLEVDAFSSIQTTREALEAKSQPSDILLTDVSLPDGDGLDLAEQLTKEKRIGKVIVMTGNADFNRIDGLMSRHGWQLLMKPFRLNQLTQLVSRLLNED